MKTKKTEGVASVARHELFAVFDDKRIEELDALLKFIRLASGLNNGSGVAEKILQLEEMAKTLDANDWDTPRQGFLGWLTAYLNANLPANAERIHGANNA